MRQRGRGAFLALLSGAAPAHAHSPVPGIEGFYVGLLHPFSTPSQALLMLGLGFLVGAFAAEKARWLLVGFLVASLVGLAAEFRFSNLDPALFSVALGACVLAALMPGRLAYLALMGAVAGGFLIGDASIPDDGPMQDRLFTMSGSIVGANLALLYVFGATQWINERYRHPSVGIVFRVAAAWAGAISLLMLALGISSAPGN